MTLTKYGSISSIVAVEEGEENAIAIDCHNCVCNRSCAFGYFNMVDDSHCYPWNTESEIVLQRK